MFLLKSDTVKLLSRQRQSNSTPPTRWWVRIGLVLAVGMLQCVLFYATYFLYHVIPYPGYLPLETWLDHVIPHVAWSWVVYYFGFFYITGWGSAGIWSMSPWLLKRTIGIYAGLVLGGFVIRMLLPSDAPWPAIEQLSAAQHAFKMTCRVEPLGGFPSMHAAMSVLPAFISLCVFRSWWTRAISVILAFAVCLSVITAREHWAIDVPAGMLLGLAAGWVWYRQVWRRRPGISSGASDKRGMSINEFPAI